MRAELLIEGTRYPKGILHQMLNINVFPTFHNVFLIHLILIFLVVILSTTISSQIVRPLQELKEAADKIIENNNFPGIAKLLNEIFENQF
mgnify:CR=1 FL=1